MFSRLCELLVMFSAEVKTREPSSQSKVFFFPGKFVFSKKFDGILDFLGTFLVAIDTTIVSVAIPKISTQFRALEDVGGYGSAYLITITALYRIFNARTVYLSAIVVFEGRPVDHFLVTD